MIKKILASLLVSAFMLLSLSPLAHANTASQQIQCGVNQASDSSITDCSTPKGAGTSINNLISHIINILSLLVGAIAVIMIIVGGFRYVASAGSDSATAGAKKTIIYALVGLVIVALAQVMVHFVLNNVTNVSANNGAQQTCTPMPQCAIH